MRQPEGRVPLKVKQRLGKYRLERKLGEGGFATVYRALDTIEGVRVALKIPFEHLVTPELLEDFRKEVRLSASLSHPNILPLKNAEFIGGHFVVAFPLGERTLGDRLQKRISVRLALDFAEQMLSAVAHAHQQKIIHCDVKPENLILFADGRLMLTDFGIAKVAQKTIRASGSGTVGYVAPEQAMGRPSFRSDVFSLGLILYRMLSGQLPEWPFQWPAVGFARLRRLHPDLVAVVRRAIEVDPRKRYRDATQLLKALQAAKSKALRMAASAREAGRKREPRKESDWRRLRFRQFQRQYGRELRTRYPCRKCGGPVSEAMSGCPWCGAEREKHSGETEFPQRCMRCKRGAKLDWKYCAWCFGPGRDNPSAREYSDVRYSARCAHPGCSRKLLMPFMRYCPWCRRKPRQNWKISGSSDRCERCRWGVASEFWSYCPWCGKALTSGAKK